MLTFLLLILSFNIYGNTLIFEGKTRAIKTNQSYEYIAVVSILNPIKCRLPDPLSSFLETRCKPNNIIHLILLTEEPKVINTRLLYKANAEGIDQFVFNLVNFSNI